ncbi:putative metalloprotease CJM1_0395 family protein [Colwelliaceae bacterium MEBiC 14330]
MNITPHATHIPLATVVNQPTETLRRENHQREIITQVAAINASAAEKAVASDKERARTPAQTNEQVDFTNLKKQAEQDISAISEQENQQQQQKQNSQQEQENNQQQTAKDNTVEAERDAEKQARIDEKIISQLKKRDREVRSHELAHATVGGSTTGLPTYNFEVGPDGRKYAVEGEVPVDLSIVAGDPKATIVKMQKVHAAALAPVNPSSQDIRVAATATQKILAAQSELLLQESENSKQTAPVNNSVSVENQSSLNEDERNKASDDFDALISQTLSAQQAISPSSEASNYLNEKQELNINQTTQSYEVIQRAQRIEKFYFTISQGYEKPENFQFELTA